MIAATDSVPKNTIEYTRNTAVIGMRMIIMAIWGYSKAFPIFFQSILTPTYPDGKGGTLSNRAFHAYLALQNIDHPLNQCKPKTVALSCT